MKKNNFFVVLNMKALEAGFVKRCRNVYFLDWRSFRTGLTMANPMSSGFLDFISLSLS